MPTASASISASSMVVELMVITFEATTMSSIESAAPMTAVTSGIIAAATDPSTTSSTTMATPMPMNSTGDSFGMLTAKISPPTCTSLPGSACCRRAPSCCSSSRWASVTVAACTVT